MNTKKEDVAVKRTISFSLLLVLGTFPISFLPALLLFAHNLIHVLAVFKRPASCEWVSRALILVD